MAAVTFDLGKLGGDFGFTLQGALNSGDAGRSVSSAGDINNDGIDDYTVSAPLSVQGPVVYVVFGKTGATRGSTNLATLQPSEGFAIRAPNEVFSFGTSVSDAGDVNGDGIDDIIIGSPQANTGSGNLTGAAYVVYGKTGAVRSSIDVTSLALADGFKINGPTDSSSAGFSVSAGDINNDGLSDFIIGAFGGQKGAIQPGEAYVVYGKSGATRPTVDLATLTAANGFVIEGVADGDSAGRSVGAVGDINGDGIGDLVIGVPFSDSRGDSTGSAYVIFGKTGTARANIDLANLSSANGFLIQGAFLEDYAGASVSSAGDINGDGITDLIVGAPGAGANFAGAAYVIFGKTGATRPAIDLANLAPADGYRLLGEVQADFTGYSVSAAGDINGDGFGDLIIGAHNNDSAGNNSGAVFVVFGKAGANRANINLTSLSAADGFKLTGTGENNFAGLSVSSAGDINNDGFADLIVGATAAPNGIGSPGEAYIIYGRSSFNFGVNTPPVAVNDSVTADEDALATFNVLTNDSDANGNALTVIAVTQPGNGIAFVNADSTVSYLANANYNGPDSFTYLISDGRGGIATATVNVTVRPVNDAPTVFATNEFSTDEDTTSNQIAIGASDIDGDALSFAVKSGAAPTKGSAIFGNNSFVYTPFADAFGSDSFTIEVSDGNGGFTEQVVSVQINPVNDDPIAVGDFFVTGQNVRLNIQLSDILANDIDVDGDELLVLSLSNLVNGTAVLNFDFIDFVSDQGFTGTASFQYRLTDRFGGESTGTVTITVSLTDPTQQVDLGDLKPTDGFAISGEAQLDKLGYSVSDAGDINGDGIADVIIAAPKGDLGGDLAGQAYVIFGTAGATGTNITLSSLASSAGFRIQGDVAGDLAGYSVSAAGDINGDGIGDLIVGAPGGDDGGVGAGEAHVIFGKAGATRANIDLTNLGSSNGFIVKGAAGTRAGTSVADLGDINGDGIADLLVGAPSAAPAGSDSGSSFVIFGKAGASRANIDLANLSGANGFAIHGAIEFGNAGLSVSAAGDVNGDGLNDFIIGAPRISGDQFDSGIAYVIFGKSGTAGGDIDLANLSPSAGFAVIGSSDMGLAGKSVSTAGDMNGDGLADIVIGMPGDAFGKGAAFVIYGKSGSSRGNVELGTLASGDGFKITGFEDAYSSYGYLGASVSGAGDFNGDGLSDIVIGEPQGSRGADGSGEVYIIYGKSGAGRANIDLSNFNPADGITIVGGDNQGAAGFSVSGAGDVNNDGFDDVVIGAPDARTGQITSGTAFVIYGRESLFGPPNEVPVAVADSRTGIEDTPATFSFANLLANDSDPDGDVLTISAVSNAINGTVVRSGQNVIFTPNPNYNGSARFDYTASDGKGGTVVARVTLTISAVNDDPTVAGSQSVNTAFLTPSQIPVSASDVDGDTLTYAAGTAGSGVVTGGAGGAFTYTPASGFFGTDSFTVTVSDGKGGSASQTVSILVGPPSASDFRLFGADGFVGKIGGAGAVFGTSTGLQDISVLDLPGSISLDPSFNRGGDIVRLSGDAADWSVARLGSNALFSDGDTIVQLPVGVTGMAVVFDDGARAPVHRRQFQDRRAEFWRRSGSDRYAARCHAATNWRRSGCKGIAVPGSGCGCFGGGIHRYIRHVQRRAG